jgi:hypothetical protein
MIDAVLCLRHHMTAIKQHAHGSLSVTKILIGTMSLGLAVGMSLLGFLDAPNAMMTEWISLLGGEAREIPASLMLLFAGFTAFFPVSVMLSCPGAWRRLIVWLSSLLLMLAWMPVLALAAWKFFPMIPLIAGVWSGMCAMIFAHRHSLPCEIISQPSVQKRIVEREVAVANAKELDQPKGGHNG